MNTASHTYEGKTATEWREEAHKQAAAKEESFERCDTDGFLTQWSHGIHDQLYRLKAQLAENDGMTDGWVLVDVKTNRVLMAKQILTRRGDLCWLLNDNEFEKYGRRFLPVNYEGKSRVHKSLGITEKKVRMRGYAKIVGYGKGLSGNAWAAIVPHINDVEKVWNGTFEVKEFVE